MLGALAGGGRQPSRSRGESAGDLQARSVLRALVRSAPTSTRPTTRNRHLAFGGSDSRPPPAAMLLG
ncbi:MAG: hypothetical protein ACK559_36065, partial [bacterium]